MFEDRDDAAQRLAHALKAWRGAHPLVVGIPRGAVPMAATIARALKGELDVVLVRKLGAPGNAELAVGAVDESGWRYVAPHAHEVGADERQLDEATERERATIRARRARYTPGRGAIEAAGRVVIVVDDGLATGATMVAALHALRARGPKRLVCAVPVASAEALALVRPLVDEIVCLETPAWFHAVGQAYRRFDQVSDDEVVEALEEGRR